MLNVLSLCSGNETGVSTSDRVAIGEGTNCPIFSQRMSASSTCPLDVTEAMEVKQILEGVVTTIKPSRSLRTVHKTDRSLDAALTLL
jgi:uncharacterized protein (UPF0179 family)